MSESAFPTEHTTRIGLGTTPLKSLEGGLTKLEYAAIHVAAGFAAIGMVPKHIALSAVRIAKEIIETCEANE